MPFDLVICDVDGCLSGEGSTPLDLADLARIASINRRAIDHGQGPVITLCTGRPQPFAEAMSRAIGNTGSERAAWLVAENGVWLYHPGTNTYEMDPAITDDHLDAVEQARRFLRAEYAPRGVTHQPGKAASISLYHPDPEYLRSLERPIRERFERERWPLRISMTWFYINCDLAHVSKATGLNRLVAKTGLVRERLAGIGDTPSDLAIREHVAWFACPSNADERLKPHADYVASRPEAAGVVEILERLGGDSSTFGRRGNA